MTEAQAQEVGGLLDGLLESILKNFKPDLAKWDRAKAKSGVALLLDSFKPTIDGPLDDMLLDGINAAIGRFIDSLTKPSGPIVVGASGNSYMESTQHFTAAQVDAFLSTCEASEERKERVRKSPRIMKVLHATDQNGNEVFSDEDRRKIVGAFPFLLLIQILGPIIIDLIMKWLGK